MGPLAASQRMERDSLVAKGRHQSSDAPTERRPHTRRALSPEHLLCATESGQSEKYDYAEGFRAGVWRRLGAEFAVIEYI